MTYTLLLIGMTILAVQIQEQITTQEIQYFQVFS